MSKVLFISLSSIKKDGRSLRALLSLRSNNIVYSVEFGDDYFEDANGIVLQETSNTIKKTLLLTRKLLKITSQMKYDFIYVANYFCCFPALVIYVFRKLPILYDAYELYYPGGGLAFSARDYFFYRIEKRCIKKASCIIVANRERALITQGYYKLEKTPFVIENYSGCPGQLISHRTINVSQIKIVYAGYISKTRGLDQLLDAVKNVRKKRELFIELSFYGSGIDEEYFINKANEFEWFHVYGQYDNYDLPMILKKHDIGFLYYPMIGINNIYCAPNKLYDYCYSGLPIVANNNIGLKTKIDNLQVGVSCDNIEDALESVIDNYEEYAKNAYNLSKFDYMECINETMTMAVGYLIEKEGII